jgi:hypothetical protein
MQYPCITGIEIHTTSIHTQFTRTFACEASSSPLKASSTPSTELGKRVTRAESELPKVRPRNS